MEVIAYVITELLELGTMPGHISMILGVPLQQVIEADNNTHIDEFCGAEVELMGYQEHGTSAWGNLGDY